MPHAYRAGARRLYECHGCSRKDFVDEMAAMQHMNTLNHWGPFRCERCHKIFRTRSALHAHLTAVGHWPGPSNTLGTPSERLDTAANLNTRVDDLGHRAGASSNNWAPFRCERCHKTFQSKGAFEAHLTAVGHWSGSSNTFETPSERLSNAADLDTRMDALGHRFGVSSNDWAPFRCQRCYRTFQSKSALEAHLTAVGHWSVPSKKCQTCLERFNTTADLNTHLDASGHRVDSPRKCETCSEQFNCAADLNTHLDAFDHRCSKKCEVCSERFSTAADLSAHMDILGHRSEPLKKCETCKERFNTVADLNTHLDALGHRLGRYWKKCETCSKQFNTVVELNAHLDALGHRLGRTLKKCEICSELFDNMAEFNAHLDLKGHRSKIRCGVCDKGLPSEAALTVHQNAQGHWPTTYTCETCPEQFSGKAHCVSHMNSLKHWAQVQAEEHKCDMCSVIFDSVKGLEEHQSMAHSAGRHECKACNRHFVSAKVLEDHLNHSTVHKPRTSQCYFCTQTFASTAAHCDHLEQGRCIGAPRDIERASIYRNVQHRDVYGVITIPKKERADGNKGATGLALANVFNGRVYTCPFCDHEASTGSGLQAHLESSAHGGTVYHCPNMNCSRLCINLTSLFGHVESGRCGFVGVETMSRQLELLILGHNIVTFT